MIAGHRTFLMFAELEGELFVLTKCNILDESILDRAAKLGRELALKKRDLFFLAQRFVEAPGAEG